MMSWQVIVNQTTCNKKTLNKWKTLLEKHRISHTLHTTSTLNQLTLVIAELLKAGHKYYLFAGGDGTLHQGGNLLIHHAGELAHQIVIGVLPCGTGNDWTRSFGIKRNKIIESLRAQKSAPLHVLAIHWPDGKKQFAFNMVGAALDAAVVASSVTKIPGIPRFLKYPTGLISTLASLHTWGGDITIDGNKLSGQWLTIQAGFGKYCGGGMFVLPHASQDSAGVLLMRPKSIFNIIYHLPKLYNGKIASQREAIASNFSEMKIAHDNKPIPVEADGEFLGYTPVTISIKRSAINRLI